MKKIIILMLSLFVITVTTSVTGNAMNKPTSKVKLVKTAASEWEFDIHNKTKYYMDDLWLAEVGSKGKIKWHKVHFNKGTKWVAPGENLHLTVSDVSEGEYYLWSLDTHAHKGHLYKLHMDHDIDIDDASEDEEEIDDVFGSEHHEGDEIDLDDQDDEEGDDDGDDDDDDDDDKN